MKGQFFHLESWVLSAFIPSATLQHHYFSRQWHRRRSKERAHINMLTKLGSMWEANASLTDRLELPLYLSDKHLHFVTIHAPHLMKFPAHWAHQPALLSRLDYSPVFLMCACREFRLSMQMDESRWGAAMVASVFPDFNMPVSWRRTHLISHHIFRSTAQ